VSQRNRKGKQKNVVLSQSLSATNTKRATIMRKNRVEKRFQTGIVRTK
jgi:hypothetical protein